MKINNITDLYIYIALDVGSVFFFVVKEPFQKKKLKRDKKLYGNCYIPYIIF